ncbi:unnamed protein product [Clonostachys rhizophaga]|uniref:Uncharacterized protein n=1 Tax=Clonostachys rhizophaga TaxID=160324 RepID=A0A9N9YVS6_9HYPO|nr:unnamed protein product [Clonostachys rhizophaga]
MPCEWRTRRTAKFSIEARYLLSRRVDTILDCLRRIRQRAAECTSWDTIIASAPQLPLPEPDPLDTELIDGHKIGDESDSSDTWGFENCDVDSQLGGNTTTVEVEEKQKHNATPNLLSTPWEETVLCDLTTRIMKIEAQSQDTASLLLYKNGATEHWVLNQCAQTDSQAASTLLSDFLELHPILTLPAPRSSCSSSSYSYYSSSEEDSSIGPGADGNGSDFTRNGDSDSCLHSQPEVEEISATQLAKLGQLIYNIERFSQYLNSSLDKERKSHRVQDERWSLRESDGNVAALMKSRGYTSPLRQCITVDEQWPSEWDLLAPEIRPFYDKYAPAPKIEPIEPKEKKPAREPRW